MRWQRGMGIPLLPDKSGKSYADYIEAQLKPIFASGKGTPFFEAVSLNFLGELRERGWQVYSYPAFADFWRLLQEKGGWWDPGEYPEVDWKKRKKFAFPTVPRLNALLKERALLSHEAGNAKRGTPVHKPLEGPTRKTEPPDSFLLAPFTTLMNMTGEGASQPLLQEISGLIPRVYWKPWAEMHPERAKKLSLKDGDLIRVVSGKGSVILRVKGRPDGFFRDSGRSFRTGAQGIRKVCQKHRNESRCVDRSPGGPAQWSGLLAIDACTCGEGQ